SPGVNIMAKLFDGSYDKLLGPDGPDAGVPVVGQNGTGYSYATCYSLRGTNRTILFVPYATSGNSGSLCWRGAFGNEATPLVYTRDTRNTTVDSSGFIKTASPIIKIFSDGSFETNDESEGAQVKRENVGVYRISNILGPHSDKAWGGIDGGFEIPKDRNGQRLLWLDYEVDADGSILVKTYHRTYPEAPAFARNTKNGYEESDPIDIPPDQFVSVRVEMPQDSIWNLAQKAAQEEMAQEEIAEE
ncbi:phage tail fiber protein, partial [Hafnia alvei]